MHYVMTDSAGNVLDTFSDDDAARSALRMIVTSQPEFEDELLLVPYDDDGSVAGEAVTFADIMSAHVTEIVSTAADMTALFRAKVESYSSGTSTGVYTRKHDATLGAIHTFRLGTSVQPVSSDEPEEHPTGELETV